MRVSRYTLTPSFESRVWSSKERKKTKKKNGWPPWKIRQNRRRIGERSGSKTGCLGGPFSSFLFFFSCFIGEAKPILLPLPPSLSLSLSALSSLSLSLFLSLSSFLSSLVFLSLFSFFFLSFSLSLSLFVFLCLAFFVFFLSLSCKAMIGGAEMTIILSDNNSWILTAP